MKRNMCVPWTTTNKQQAPPLIRRSHNVPRRGLKVIQPDEMLLAKSWKLYLVLPTAPSTEIIPWEGFENILLKYFLYEFLGKNKKFFEVLYIYLK